MSCNSLDLTIESAVADPVIGAVMRADRVDPQGFEALLRSKARSLGVPRPRFMPSFGAMTGRLRREPCGATP